VKRAIQFVLPALVAMSLAACERPTTTVERTAPVSPPVPEKAQVSPATTEAKSEAPAADAALGEKVLQALVTERGINARDLQVNAQNGVVTLSGKVEEKSDQERMMLVAMSVDGVRSVVSNLVVERPA